MGKTIFDDLEVPLDDVAIKAGGGYALKVGYGLDTIDTGERYEEDCPKCGGRGRFISWAGRDCGPCRKCKGKGKIAYKNPAHIRTKQRADVTERKRRKLAAAVEKYREDNPEIANWLDGSSATFEFAGSLSAALAKYGSLTDKQAAAAHKCIAKTAESRKAAEERAESAPDVDIARIADAFATAREAKLKWPKLRLADFVFSLARDNSQNPGAIYVKAGETYLGKIVDGRLFGSRECSAEIEAAILKIASDPEAAAIAYGIQTGACSCCGRELTVAESVERGIGPVCAAKYGW